MAKDFLKKALDSKNVAELLDEKKLEKVARVVLSALSMDKSSKAEWNSSAEQSLELAKMKWERKDTPWPGAANIKHPMIARAIIQFTSNILTEVIRRGKIVRHQVIGKDPDGAKAQHGARVEDFTNYQMLSKNQKWLDSFERSLSLLATVGVAFRKVYFDPIKKENIVEFCSYDEVSVTNNVSSLDNARRISHEQKIHSNTLVEWMRGGYYTELTDDELYINDIDGHFDSRMHDIVEQHCYLDLDEDGYEEPYIVIVHKDYGKVLRILPRFDKNDIQYNSKKEVVAIIPTVYFVDYHCIINFDGSFYSLGFGSLLLTMAETINTSLNQLTNAGHLATTQSGFMSKDLNLKSGEFKLKPGLFHKIDSFDGDIRKSIQPLVFAEPSQTLFALTGMLNDLAKELSSTTDILSGNQLAQNAPATTTLSLIERGLKVYNAIQKRIYRSLSKEINLLHKLNRKYLNENEYIIALDDPLASKLDFETDQIDIIPVADPEISSETQRLAQADVLFNTYQFPEVNKYEILTRYYEAAGIKEIESILQPPDQQPPDPGMVDAENEQMKIQVKAQAEQAKAELKQQEFQLKVEQEQFKQQMDQLKLENETRKLEIDQLKAILNSQDSAFKAQTDYAKAVKVSENRNRGDE